MNQFLDFIEDYVSIISVLSVVISIVALIVSGLTARRANQISSAQFKFAALSQLKSDIYPLNFEIHELLAKGGSEETISEMMVVFEKVGLIYNSNKHLLSKKSLEYLEKHSVSEDEAEFPRALEMGTQFPGRILEVLERELATLRM